MNESKTYIYDERPGFETYSMMNFPYQAIPMGGYNIGNYNPMGNYNNDNYNNYNNLENIISKLENQIDNLQNRVSRLESNIYPQAMDYGSYPKATYQTSMNVM